MGSGKGEGVRELERCEAGKNLNLQLCDTKYACASKILGHTWQQKIARVETSQNKKQEFPSWESCSERFNNLALNALILKKQDSTSPLLPH